MNLKQIKEAVDAGKKVYWLNSGYEVIKDNNGNYLIKHINGSYIGLTWQDDTTLNGEEEAFFMDCEPMKHKHDSNGRILTDYVVINGGRVVFITKRTYEEVKRSIEQFCDFSQEVIVRPMEEFIDHRKY